ncbi:MAG: glycosyltransferase family 2 protein [Oscillospiraceae bacterium]|nr:glycosyltransferase family 2 protein [Oscillospiraceae bacterium]
MSIIVPVYNVEQYIDECINSLLNQTFENYEIIFVDDGSRDNSGSICDVYCEKYPNICKVFHKENQGVLSARDFGVKKANGDIIVFLDSDDCLRKDALEKICCTFEKKKCDMVLFEFSNNENYNKKEINFDFINNEEVEKKHLYKQMLLISSSNAVCLKATKRSLFNTAIDYSKFYFVKHGEDLLQSLQIVTDAKKIVYIDEVLYYYRQRENSTVHSFDPNRHKSIKAVHQELEKYIDLWEVPEYHPLHYAREVRGWVDTLFLYYDGKADSEILRELAEDEYFRNAYEKMDSKELSKKNLIAAKLLYERKYKLLEFYIGVIDALRKIKMKIK